MNHGREFRVLVTGAAGFVGSHLCEALVAAGHDVLGVDAFVPYYPRSVKETNLAPLRQRCRFRFVELDLRTEDLAEVLEGVDIVVNEAAMPGLPRSWTDFELYASCNLHAVQRLLVAASAAGVRRFVQASTSSVYGVEAMGDETTPTRPISPYGVTKLAAEHLVDAYHRTTGLAVVILRYFSVYGPRQRPDMAYHRFIRALAAGEEIVVYGDGRQTRSSTYVGDCVRGTVQAITGARDGEVYNVGGGEPLALLDVIEVIAEILGVQPRIRFEPARPGDQRHTAADTAKAAAHFGYGPTVAPREGIARQIAWQFGERW